MLFRACCLLLLLTLVCTTTLQAAKPALSTRSFKVPLDFLSIESHAEPPPKNSAANDPFAPPKTSPANDPFGPDAAPATSAPDDPAPRKLLTPRQIFEGMGVTFPEGASASFNPFTGLLTITNTAANLEIIELYADALNHLQAANVAFTLTLVEAPGELIREADAMATRDNNAAPALAMLLDHAKKPGSNVCVVGDGFLETKSGTRATLNAGVEHRYVSEVAMDAKSRAAVATEMRRLGLHLEIEPTVNAEGTLIETTLALEFNAAPPTVRQLSMSDPATGSAAEFPLTDVTGSEFITSASIPAGGTKIIGITRPVGTPREKADLLCAVFLTATLRRVEDLPTPQPKVAAPAAIPRGMQFAAMHAPDGVFDDALRTAKLETQFAEAGITFPSGSVLEHRDGVLRCVNTPDNIALISAIVDRDFAIFPKTVAFTFHTLEAPATLLRDLTRQTLASADDSAMFAALDAAVARGEARFIDSTFLETTSSSKASHSSICDHRYLDNQGTDDKGNPSFTFGTRSVGSIIELEATVGADSRTVELTYSHELHPAPAITRRAQFRDPASQQLFDRLFTDFNVNQTVTSISLTKGSTKLLSVNTPTGRENTGVLWATLVKCEVVPQVFKSIHTATAAPPAAPKDPEAIHTRAFRVPPDFLSSGEDSTSKRDHVQHKTAKQMLEAAGITFPKGAAAFYSATTTQLIVTNTDLNLDLVEAYTSWRCYFPRTIAITTHILQGPGPLLRRLTAQASSTSDHRAELNELLAAVKASTVQHLNMARIETKPGTRATSTQAQEHIDIAGVGLNKQQQLSFSQEMRQVGLRMELEPTMLADGTIALTLAPEFHTAPPFEHREHILDPQGHRLEFPLTDYFTTRTTTSTVLRDGRARLISLYRPVGKPAFEKDDILQAIFITCDIMYPKK